MRRVANDSLLEQFHQDVRVNAVAVPGYQVVRELPTVRLVGIDKRNSFNTVLCSDLDESNADSIIEREIGYFRKRNEPFEWKLFHYDRPHDLAERLTLHGLKEAEKETLLVATLKNYHHQISVPPQVTILKVEKEKELRTLLETVSQDETNPEHLEALLQNLLTNLREAKETIGIFGAYWDGKPASIGWAFYTPQSRFCGLFGGTTHSSFRGKGLYKALVQKRAEEARQKGFSYLFVDAGPMSRPILEKLGFSELTTMQGFHWSPY